MHGPNFNCNGRHSLAGNPPGMNAARQGPALSLSYVWPVPARWTRGIESQVFTLMSSGFPYSTGQAFEPDFPFFTLLHIPISPIWIPYHGMVAPDYHHSTLCRTDFMANILSLAQSSLTNS